jgi:hypothetical protein
MKRMFLIAEAVGNSLQILTDKHTGFTIVFSDRNIAFAVADETCDSPYQIIEVQTEIGRALWAG